MYLGLDLGTSGAKALLIDDAQTVIAEAKAPLTVQMPHPNWSEQDPDSWIAACETAILKIRETAPTQFAALRSIAVSGQMHGATLLDENDRPLRPAILWNDGRSILECVELEARADFRRIGGNIVMAGFTAPKLEWVRKNEPDLFSKVKKVLLPKDYVGLWLTGRHMSEMSDAAGTLWLDVANRRWSATLLDAGHLTTSQMPDLVEGSEQAGVLRADLASAWGVSNVSVAGGAGDNAATACGLGMTRPRDAFFSLGTSGVLFTAADHFAANIEGAVHSFCHAIPDTWHQMGVILSATDSLNWLSSIVRQSPKDLSALVPEYPNLPSPVTFLPYLSGERTPHNDPNASGSFIGLRRNHDLSDITQAVLEGVAFALKDCKLAINAAGIDFDHVWMAGGGSQSKAWLNIIASVTGLTLRLPKAGAQGAALGAARLAMMAVGRQDVLKVPDMATQVVPDPSLSDAYAARFEAFQAAYELRVNIDPR